MDSGFSEFFSQIPSIFILMFCGSGVLLLVVVGSIIRTRSRQNAAAVPQAAGAAVYSSYSDMGDLPDLDELASTPPPAPAAPARVNGAHAVALAGGESVEVVEVLTVLRDVAEGGLIIQIGDKAYRNPPATADADFKRRLNTTLRDLREALQTGTLQAPATLAPAANGTAADQMDTPTVQPAIPPTPAPSAPPVPPPAPSGTGRLSPYEPAPGDLPKFRMPDEPVKPKRGKRPAPEPIPEINIAGSIEAFLQHKLVRTPEYSHRSIHVVPASHGGVKIEVDGVYFESVGEVTDEAVRQFLASTIEEWQARQ